MKPRTYDLNLTENELLAIERALDYSNANSTISQELLAAFFSFEIGDAARSAYKKVGKLHREIQMAVGKEGAEEDEKYLREELRNRF
jgi:hypothetical protein